MSKKPFVTKEQVEEIVKTYPTPFHLYDEKGIRENAKALKEAFAWNPGYKEYFAVKATPNPFLLQLLHMPDYPQNIRIKYLHLLPHGYSLRSEVRCRSVQ